MHDIYLIIVHRLAVGDRRIPREKDLIRCGHKGGRRGLERLWRGGRRKKEEGRREKEEVKMEKEEVKMEKVERRRKR